MVVSRGTTEMLITTCLALAITAPRAHGAWPHDPNNGNVALCAAAEDQSVPTIISDGAGGAIVAWHDGRDGSSDIYAQRVSAAGVPQWAANGVALCTAASHQGPTAIASDGLGGAIVAWVDSRSGSSADIYAQRVSAAGVPLWTTNGVTLCATAGDQLALGIASDGAGGAVVVWQDLRGGNDADIYAQRVSPAGVPRWTANGVALCTAAHVQRFPMIVSDGAGGAIVTWEDGRGGSGIYAQRVSAVGVPQWVVDGVPLTTVASDQRGPTIVADGAGGAIVAWGDARDGFNFDIYAQRVSAAGVRQWSPSGVALCVNENDQFSPSVVSDHVGGAIVLWRDFRNGVSFDFTQTNADLFAQRVSAAGTPQWATDGVALCTAAGDQLSSALVADGAGGAIVSWSDRRSGLTADTYVQRVSALGVSQWAIDGVALSAATNDQSGPVIATDGSGGAIAAWGDLRNGSDYDIYAQRVERFGQLGNPEPLISRVGDVRNDQGGFVKVSWNASYVDADPTYGVYDYRVWRSVPAALAARARGTASLTRDPDEAARTGGYLIRPLAGEDYAWEPVGLVSAAGLASYSLVVATTGDSMAGSNPYTAFMVEARTSTVASSAHWFSAPDSGYSVDNLPPGTPTPFTGNYLAGATHLHWGVSSASDLAGYRLYRGSSAGFAPSVASLVVAQPDTGYVDVGAAGSYYKLSAVDIRGNESPFALLSPAGTTDVGARELPRVLALAVPHPNPARSQTTFAFTLPAGGAVRLALYGTDGRHVRTVTDARMEAGDHRLSFGLSDGGGRSLPSGIYHVRLEWAGHALSRRLVVVQ